MGEIITKFILIPFFGVLSIWLVGQLIEALFGLPEAGKLLFWALGGIGFFALYFRSVLSNW
jgi:hypothetical protein